MSDAAGTPAAESSPNAASSPHRQQLDKSTQTTESFMQLLKQSPPSLAKPIPLRPHTPSSTAAGRSSGSDADPQLASSFERTIVQRAPTGRSGLTVMAVVGTQLSATTASLAELSVSSTTQTQSSSPQHHMRAHPMSIPVRPVALGARPMRSSVEGLNQEIEKLVMLPDQPHTCRPETNLFSRGETPDDPSGVVVDVDGGGLVASGSCGAARRSVNTQTPSGDCHSSDDSQSNSPDDDCGGGGGALSSGAGASPRINRFLAREPPDGCEKVSLKLTETDQQSHSAGVQQPFKPCVGFRLRASQGSAFQPIGAGGGASAAEDLDAGDPASDP